MVASKGSEFGPTRTIIVTRNHEIEVPVKASHYGGDLLDEPSWYLSRIIGGHEYWFVYSYSSILKRFDWLSAGYTKPEHIKEIPS